MSGPAKGMTAICHRCRTRVNVQFSVRALDVDWCHACCAAKIIEVEALKIEAANTRTGRIDVSKPHHSQKPKKHPF